MQHHSLPVLDPQYSVSISLMGIRKGLFFGLAGHISDAGLT